VVITAVTAAMTASVTRIQAQSLVFISSSKGTHSAVSKDTGCECIGYNCGCCVYMDVPKLGLNDTGCVNVSYLPAPEYGISLTFDIDGYIVMNETISARNPPPICFGVPHLEKEVSLCVDFYNLSVSSTSFDGCVKIEARFVYVIEEEYDLGCFDLGPHISGSHYEDQTSIYGWREWLKELERAQVQKQNAIKSK